MANILGLSAAKRTLIVPALLAMAVLPASATRHLTVEQLEKALASSAAKHHADADMMKEFGDFDLTERLTDAARSRITTSLHLGPQTTLALQLLADESAVLDPPAGELPKDVAPDGTSQKHILDLATVFMDKTLAHLPDFLATRTTYTFNDTPQIFKVNEWPVHAGLHLMGKTSHELTYRDDHVEQAAAAAQGGKAHATQTATTVAAPTADAKTQEAAGASQSASASLAAGSGPAAEARPAQERGLQSFGEFGQLLRLILVDTEKHPATFHHWEQTPAGLVAVYRYAVAKADSHYTVSYCCISENMTTSSRGGGGGRRGGGGGRGAGGSVATGATIPLHMVPAYHGSLFIDPATGIVRRMTLEAEMGDGTVKRADTVIEYGQVAIGDRKFVCPLRSMYIWMGPEEGGQPSSELAINIPQSLLPKGTLYVNETSFSEYHRLGSEIRILTEAETKAATGGEGAKAVQK
jgi:hypothetical protein